MALSTSRHILIQECRELLTSVETVLLQIGEDAPSDEQINAVFRAAHTIKGSAGLFGLSLIVVFTHRMESVLDKVRDKSVPLNARLIALLLRSGDYLWRLVDAIEQETDAIDPDAPLRAELLSALDEYLPRSGAANGADGRAAETVTLRRYQLSLRFDPRELREGLDPVALLEHLETLGTLRALETLLDRLPTQAEFDPEQCYLGFSLELETSESLSTLENCLTFVRDERGFRITPIEPPIVALEKVAPDVPPAKTATKPKSGEERRGADTRMLKVDAAKLDDLINLVGELVIASEGARSLAHLSKQGALVESLHKVTHLVEQLRDRTLNMRMTPIGQVFSRFPRVVRDVSRELNKRVELVITGAETELDKSMVEKLADPLLHIVRNAMDHGIEPPEERRRGGKSESARLSMHAYHESGCIVIEIGDDGRGLNGERILQKAIERKLVPPGTLLAPEEIHPLIFLPGFSTAEQVTNLSGRGVGMDVVKRSVEALRGEIEIESAAGLGTLFRIRLPLTLAIIDGFQVAVGKTTFVVPLEMVVECVDVKRESGGRRVLDLRGEPLPYLRLAEVFGLSSVDARRESMVVVEYGNQRVGMVVERLMGDIQAVIKPLGRIFRNVRGVSSSTILGDGSVALVLDVPALMQRAEHEARVSQARKRALAS